MCSILPATTDNAPDSHAGFVTGLRPSSTSADTRLDQRGARSQPAEAPLVPIRLGRSPTVAAELPQSKLLVSKGQAGSLTQAVTLRVDLSAPIAKGSPVGTLTVKSGDTVLAELPLTSAADVERMSWSDLFLRLLQDAVFG